MSAHSHDHGVTAAGSHRWRLALVLCIGLVVLTVEVAGALWSGSLALLADAGGRRDLAWALHAALRREHWDELQKRIGEGSAPEGLGELTQLLLRIPTARRWQRQQHARQHRHWQLQRLRRKLQDGTAGATTCMDATTSIDATNSIPGSKRPGNL